MSTIVDGEADKLEAIYQITSKSSNKDWRQLLEFGQTLELTDKRKLLWVWPSETELHALGSALRVNGVDCLLSIGCGTGLLEWILRESLAIDVYGLEADRGWWQSKYCVRNFIDLNYAEDMPANCADSFLQTCAHRTNWNFALLFCYFNNREAFLDYLHAYKGNWVVLIGPRTEVAIHTDPLPLEPRFPDTMQWRIRQVINLGAHDLAVFYTNVN